MSLTVHEAVTTLVESGAWKQGRVHASATLITYNQERYVRAALESVLRQTYPLDVVISDDGSTDATVAVIHDVLRRYNGPHRVRLRRGARNLGVCGNQNAALTLAEGDLVVLFEGDDISVPWRVDRIVEAYAACGGSVGAIGSGIRKVDAEGRALETAIWTPLTGDAWTLVRGDWAVHGCSLAIRRDAFSAVGPISRHLISGDITLWMRAAFLDRGGLCEVPEVLLDYRLHTANVGARWGLDYSSVAELRNRCRRLIPNEVAQVFELNKIRRYRTRLGLRQPTIDRALRQLCRIARRRAELVMAVSQGSRLRWGFLAALSLRHRQLRAFASRSLALAIFPDAPRLYRFVSGRAGRGVNAKGLAA